VRPRRAEEPSATRFAERAAHLLTSRLNKGERPHLSKAKPFLIPADFFSLPFCIHSSYKIFLPSCLD